MSEGKLSNTVLLFITINAILGSSLFYLPSVGVIAAGAASIISWVVLFILAAFAMLYIGELVTLHPSSGGTYEFCKRAYGRFGSFFAGWLIWLAGNFGMALGLIAAAQYFLPGTDQQTFLVQIIFVVIWAFVLHYMAYRKIDAGTTMLMVFGVIAVFVVLAMTLPSFIDVPSLFSGSLGSSFDSSLLQPFFRQEGFSTFSFLGLALLLISEAFFGFEAVSYMANEAKEPRKLHLVLLKAVIISGIIMTIYLFSSLGTVTYGDYVTDSRPFAVQAANTLGSIGQQIVVFGMYLVIIGSIAAWPIVGSRLIRAMAKDKLFPTHFAVLHQKHGSPHRAVYFQGIAVLVFSWVLFRGYLIGWNDPYRTVYLIYVLLSFFVLCMILLTVPILRRKEAKLVRPFKAPLGTVGPIFLVTLFIVLIINWFLVEGGTASSIVLLAGSFAAIGVPFYFLVEMFYDSRAIIKVNESLSYFIMATEKIVFPFSMRKKILDYLGPVEGKKVLEYGCSVGSLTKHLAHKVGSKGMVIATDLSEHKVRINTKRTQHLPHVTVHHHPHLDDFKLKIPRVDMVLSIGTLSYLQKPEKVLASLAKKVKKGGLVAFIDYDRFFYLIPNVAWIEDDVKLVALFKKAGFEVEVFRKKGLFWQYIIIEGARS